MRILHNRSLLIHIKSKFHRLFMQHAFMSQIISSLTTFLSSVIVLNLLDGSELKKWFLYLIPSLALQGVIRNVYLETDLITYGSVQKKTFDYSAKFALFPLFLYVGLNLILDTRIELIDFIAVIYSMLVIIQDLLRYRLIKSSPKLVLLADLVWAIVFLCILLFTVSFDDKFTKTILVILLCGPCLSTGILLGKLKRNLRSNNSVAKLMDYPIARGILIINNFVILFSTIVINTLITASFSHDEFYLFRVTQTLISPIQSIGLAIWVSQIIHSTNDSIAFPKKIIVRSLSINTLIISILTLFAFFCAHLEVLGFDGSQATTLIVGTFSPIINMSFYALSLTMRKMQKFREIAFASFFSNTLLVILIILNAKKLTVLEFYLYQGISMSCHHAVLILAFQGRIRLKSFFKAVEK